MAITISGENNNDRILASDGVIDQISGINIVGLITASHINVGSNIQLGNAGIITATTFVGNVTGNVNSTSPLLLQTGGSERFRITGNNELGIAGANYGTSGQVLTSGGSGSAVSWTTIPTQVNISNNSNNRVITGGGGINLVGESNLTFDGNTLFASGNITAASDGNRATQGNVALVVRHSTNAAMRANHFIHDDFPSGSGTYYIQVTESGVTNDRNLALQGYGGKVKIGSGGVEPVETLDVSGNVKATSINLANSIFHTGDTDTLMSFSTDTIKFDTAGDERLNIGSTGTVWVKSGDIKLGTTSGTDSIIHTTNAAGILYRADENGHRFQTYVGGWQDRLRVKDDGKVGVGIDPTVRFHLKLSSRTSDFRITDSDTTADVLRAGSQPDGDGHLQLRTTGGTGPVLFDASGSSYITGGNFGVGTASPTRSFHVKGMASGNSTNRMAIIESTGTAGSFIAFQDANTTDDSKCRVGSIGGNNLGLRGDTHSFQDGGGNDRVHIDSAGRLLVNTTSSSISSAELFEVKSTGTGFSHFRNNSSTYAPIYIDNEATNNGSTLVPIITVTDGGGNRAGFLLNNNSDFNVSGQGTVSLSTGGTVMNATERLVVETNSGIGKLKVQGEAHNGTVYGLEIIGNQQTNAVSGADAGARIIAPVARRMYFELRANDDTDHFAWLGNPDYDTGNADTILMELHPKGYLQKPLQPSFHIGAPYNSGTSSGQVWKSHSNAIYSNVGSHYNNSTGRFTAPVDGQYFFFHWGMSNTSGQTNDVYSRKNGSRDQIGTSYNQASGAGHNQFGCSYIRTLSAGDYVDVYVANGNTYGTTDGRHGGWGGWLIG